MNTTTTTTPAAFTRVNADDFYRAGCRAISHLPDAQIHCRIALCRERQPLVTIQEAIGSTGDYRPDELRSIAAKLLRMAADAKTQPKGKRTYAASFRRY